MCIIVSSVSMEGRLSRGKNNPRRMTSTVLDHRLKQRLSIDWHLQSYPVYAFKQCGSNINAYAANLSITAVCQQLAIAIGYRQRAMKRATVNVSWKAGNGHNQRWYSDSVSDHVHVEVVRLKYGVHMKCNCFSSTVG